MGTRNVRDVILKKKVGNILRTAETEISKLIENAHAARIKAAVFELTWDYMAARLGEIADDWVPGFDKESEDFRRGMLVAFHGFEKEVRQMEKDMNRTIRRPTKSDLKFILELLREEED